MSDSSSNSEGEFESKEEVDGKQKSSEAGLVRLIFSWSLKDVFNRNLLKHRVSILLKHEIM